jgi:hypothetical protein
MLVLYCIKIWSNLKCFDFPIKLKWFTIWNGGGIKKALCAFFGGSASLDRVRGWERESPREKLRWILHLTFQPPFHFSLLRKTSQMGNTFSRPPHTWELKKRHVSKHSDVTHVLSTRCHDSLSERDLPKPQRTAKIKGANVDMIVRRTLNLRAASHLHFKKTLSCGCL